jgi:hypothetical protein
MIIRIMKDVLSGNPASDDVIQPALDLNPHPSCHILATILTTSPSNRNIASLTLISS